MICGQCGTANQDGNRFCFRCGRELARVPDAGAAAAAPVAGPSAPAPTAAAPSAPYQAWTPQHAPVVVGTNPLSFLQSPFTEKGPRVAGGSRMFVGKAGAERMFVAHVSQALRPFRAGEESVDGYGLQLERRTFVVATRGPATAAVHATSIGVDLHASWHVFCRRQLDPARVLGLGVLAIVLAIPGGLRVDLFGLGLATRFDAGAWLGSAFWWVVIVGVLTLWAGFTFRRDPLGYLKAPLNEFQMDDAEALRQQTEAAVTSWD